MARLSAVRAKTVRRRRFGLHNVPSRRRHVDYKKIYDEKFADPAYNNSVEKDGRAEVMESIRSMIDIARFRSVVDVGSGRGHVIRYILGRRPDSDVLSVDLGRYHDMDCRFMEADISEGLSLDKKYDLLVCTDVFEHLALPRSKEVVGELSGLAREHIFSVANNWEPMHLTIKPLDWWVDLIRGSYKIRLLAKSDNVAVVYAVPK